MKYQALTNQVQQSLETPGFILPRLRESHKVNRTKKSMAGLVVSLWSCYTMLTEGRRSGRELPTAGGRHDHMPAMKPHRRGKLTAGMWRESSSPSVVSANNRNNRNMDFIFDITDPCLCQTTLSHLRWKPAGYNQVFWNIFKTDHKHYWIDSVPDIRSAMKGCIFHLYFQQFKTKFIKSESFMDQVSPRPQQSHPHLCQQYALWRRRLTLYGAALPKYSTAVLAKCKGLRGAKHVVSYRLDEQTARMSTRPWVIRVLLDLGYNLEPKQEGESSG